MVEVEQGAVCGLERMNHTRCVMLVLLAEPFDGVFPCRGQGTSLPPGGVALLPHIGSCKGPHIAKTHVMVQLHSSPPLPKKQAIEYGSSLPNTCIVRKSTDVSESREPCLFQSKRARIDVG